MGREWRVQGNVLGGSWCAAGVRAARVLAVGPVFAVGLVLAMGSLTGCGDDGGSTGGPDGSVDGSTDCGTENCSGHGSCDASTGEPVCVCDEGYVGDDCGACAAEFQDNDADGTCSAACADDTCSGNGTCDDSSGSAVCTCDANFEGDDCSKCAFGFQDNDGDGTCDPGCGEDTCSGNGTCAEDSGGVVCTCNEGWTAIDCSECETGLQDNDGDGVCSPVCDAATCSDNGNCDDSSGTAVCECATGWAGSSCNTCDLGFEGTSCDTCSAGYAGSACEFRRVYGLDIPTQAKWDSATDVPYDIDETAAIGAFDRIAYRLELNGQFVWAAMDAFTDDVSKIGVPTDWDWDQAVSNLTVSTDVPGVLSLNNAPGGTIEFWSNCYAREPSNTYDYNDTNTQYNEDCYGSMQVHHFASTLFAFNRWSSGSGDSDVGLGRSPTGQPDWTFAQNAAAFASKRLAVYVRPVRACTGSICGTGSCADTTGVALCTCADDGYVGGQCQSCATGYNDHDGDGVCTLDCQGGRCEGLDRATDLSTGLHSFKLISGVTPLYVDGDHDGGGWVLVGRGRDGWDFDNRGRGAPASVKDGLASVAGFAPRYLPTALVQGLITATAGSGTDLSDIEMRIKRATDSLGLGYQEAVWTWNTLTTWDWQFAERNQLISHAVADSALGAGATRLNARTRDASPANDHTRIFTWRWSGHAYADGFSFGSTVTGGTNDALNFLWQSAVENHALPYTEVYLRPKRCTSDADCSGNGTCGGICRCDTGFGGLACDRCAFGYHDNDGDGSCEVSCEGLSCGSGQACYDTVGAATCVAVSGASCFDILMKDSSAADGVYGIDPDGSGGAEPVAVRCDMTNGGWTELAFESFASGTATGWSDTRVDSTSNCAASFGTMLGGYNLWGRGTTATKVFDLIGVTHTEARVELDYVVLDSWDSEDAVVSVDGAEIYRQTFRHQDSPNPNVCGAGWEDFGPQPVAYAGAHVSDSLTLEATATINSGPADESFGLRNVRVLVR